MDRLVLLSASMLFWMLSLIFFRRAGMNFFKFLIGSVGIFLISVIFFVSQLEPGLNTAISFALSFVGEATNYFHVFSENSIVSFGTGGSTISLFIDYECSGIIEMLVFTSMALFFPFGGAGRRFIMLVAGNMFIYFANLIRVLFIIGITKVFGASFFYIAHTLLGRIFFFGLMVVLYYFAFTSTHLKYQRVGDIK